MTVRAPIVCLAAAVCVLILFSPEPGYPDAAGLEIVFTANTFGVHRPCPT